jgi:thiol-disulfide isomerase/thioredoxin
MKVLLGVALSVPLLLQQPPSAQPSAARTTATAAIDAASDPADCAKALSAFVSARRQEIRTGAGFTPAALTQVDQEKAELGRTCISRFAASSNPAVLPGMADLYAEIGLTAEARRAVTAALAAPLTPEGRAAALTTAVNVTVREPKSDERNARIEAFIDELDGNRSATFDQKWFAHTRMESYYRGDDIDAGIIKHARWIAQASRSFTPEQRKRFGPTVLSSQVNMAEALAGQGLNDDALALLRKAASDWNGLGRSEETYVSQAIERYSLVGTAAAPIKAKQWLNAPSDLKETPLKELSMTGAVTLLEFTAHWCGPCRESYPGVNRLRERFAQGFRVVMVTRYWGYFSSPGALERDITRDEEYKRDAAYFADYHLDVPVAIGDLITTRFTGGAVTYSPGPDPNETAYKVSAIPQIHLIDKKGRIRLIMIGYDDANEPKLADIVAKLLAES